jgi:hypothetical protein
MAEESKETHPDELRSDLDLLIEMAKDLDKDREFVHRHLESLKTKLDHFVHHSRSGAGSAG